MPPASPSRCLVATAPENTLTVLLVDDDETFRRGLADNLRDDGHGVFEYAAPSEVPPLPTLGEVHVMVTDYEVPDSSGLCFADFVHAVCPAMPIIVLTTHWEASLVLDAAARPFVRLLR